MRPREPLTSEEQPPEASVASFETEQIPTFTLPLFLVNLASHRPSCVSSLFVSSASPSWQHPRSALNTPSPPPKKRSRSTRSTTPPVGLGARPRRTGKKPRSRWRPNPHGRSG